MVSMEKNGVSEPSGKLVHDSLSDDSLSHTPMSNIDEAALVRKIDRRLLPILFVMYICAFLDRVNISNALTMKLPADLHLVGDQRNVALTIFFVPYIVFEIPSNILMKKLSPHVWLSGCILAFGIVMLAQGFVKSYGGLLATRFFLGLAEAGIFPGSFYLISIWYKREESLKRFTVYWCSVLFASMFGGLLASAIENMDGLQGLHDWQWIFILEGILTILVGFSAYFLVCDFPETASWLTEEEKLFAVQRVGGTGGDISQKVTTAHILTFFKSPKNVIGALMYLTLVVPLYSLAYFAPTIIKTYGYSTIQTQLHTVPPFAASLGLCVLFAYLSDRLRIRWPFLAISLALAIIGLAILITTHDSFSAEYLGICFVAMGVFAGGIVMVCWYIMNLQGHIERAIGSAWMIGFGNAGGIVATFCFLTKDAPYYHQGYSICIGAMCICAAASTVYGLLCVHHNRNLGVDADGEKQVPYSM